MSEDREVTTLLIAVVVIGVVIAYLIAKAPSRAVRLLEESQAKAKLNVAFLD